MTLLGVSLFIVFLSGLVVANSQRPLTENALIQEYFNKLKESSYDTKVAPEPDGGHGLPVEVACTMFVLDVFEVDDHIKDYKIQLYFRQSWNDSRLSYLDQDIHEIVINDQDKIWTPDLFFVQEKEGTKHNLVTSNTFIKIRPDGEILFSVRLTMTFSCAMDLRKYPHDVQKCNFNVESYGFTADKMKLTWDNRRHSPVQYSSHIDLSNFKLANIKEGISYIELNSGRYTSLDVSLTFQRKVGVFMTRLFIPFIVLVVLSWLSFWIPPKMMSARLSLLLITLYFMLNIGWNIEDFIPLTSYTKGSDVWIAVCESLVFFAFLEFIAVYIIDRNKGKLEKKANDPEAQNVLGSDTKVHSMSGDPSSSAAIMIACRLKRACLVSERIDKISRITFPVLFLIFNFVYWMVYCIG